MAAIASLKQSNLPAKVPVPGHRAGTRRELGGGCPWRTHATMAMVALLQVARVRRSWSSGVLRRKLANVYQMSFIEAWANSGCARVRMVVRPIGHIRTQAALVRQHRALEQEVQANPGGLLAL
jgi:hypothetical protein